MRLLTLPLVALLILAGCDSSDNSPDPTDDVQRFRVTVENVAIGYPILKNGVFNTPEGASQPGPIFPGDAYTFSFTAGPNVTPGSGMRLSLATMFIQSNDAFYAFPPSGLALYDDNGDARTGDVTSELFLYDAGTEVNEEPGTGANQAPRQSGANTGTAENGSVTLIADGATDPQGFSYPNKADVIQVTLAHDGTTGFTVRIANVSTASTLATSTGSVAVPLSPGGWAVHTDAIDFYEVGAASSGGLEDIAEDGSPAALAGELAPLTGVTVPLSPGAYATHTDAARLFTVGQSVSPGLEDIAEDGSPAVLAAALATTSGVRSSGAFTTPVGASAPAPIGPGGSYQFEVDAVEGERLSLATMYIQSNDVLIAPRAAGIALFASDGQPISGDVSDQLLLWDAGTEVDEEPGVGLDQAPRQSGPDTGASENGTLVEIDGMDGGFTYRSAETVMRVTVTPLG